MKRPVLITCVILFSFGLLLFHQISAQKTNSTFANFFSPFIPNQASNAIMCDRTTDSLALVALYNSTNGLLWSTQWNLNQPMDTWFGITLYPEGCVRIVNLENNNLDGTIPNELTTLTNVEVLDLSSNNTLTGNIPVNISNLFTLEELNFGGCSLDGSIPASIGNLVNLETTLNLRSNSLSGPIPSSIGNLVNLFEIDFGNNQLSGNLPPEIGNCASLFFLYLDNNQLDGDIPSELGNATNLVRLWLDDNQFTGEIPLSFGNLTLLQVLWVSNNNLEGPIPDTFQNMSSLNHFEIQGNSFNYLPDLSMLPIEEQINKLRIQENNFTFDDILPNFGPQLGNFYFPQDSVGMEETLIACLDQSFAIDLGIDSGILSNEYEWFKNGVFFTAVTGNNQLEFPNIGPGDVGVYTCTITNPNAPLLTLNSRPVTITVECCDVEVDIDSTLCSGGTLVVNGTTYGQPPAFPSFGIEVLPDATSCGADSLIIVNLTFFDSALLKIDSLLCAEGSININGTEYDQDNPNGMEILPGASVNGCDSFIMVQLSFSSEVETTLSPTLCPGDTLFVNGVAYFDQNPTGTEVIMNGAAEGCDSTITIDLSFFDSVITNIDNTICPDDTIFVNNVAYYDGNSSGTEIMQAVTGCDSIIQIQLSFFPITYDTISFEICEGESFDFAGKTLTQSGLFPDTLSSINGCDSVIVLDLLVNDTAQTTIQGTICAGDSLFFNNNFLTQPGQYRDTLSTTTNCDSFVILELIVNDTFQTIINQSICRGDQTDFFGNSISTAGLYEEVLIAQNGCDSTVILNLSILDTFQTQIDTAICLGESTEFNNRNLINQGTYRDTLTAQNGCDSFIVLNLNILDTFQTILSPSICKGDTLLFNDMLLTSEGSYRDTLIAINGCDSFIILNLSINPTFETNLFESICENEFLLFGGDTLNAAGIYRDTFSVTGGCDSVVILDLEVRDTFITHLFPSLCAGECLTVGNADYCSDTLIQENLTAQNGCDSTVFYNLSIRDTFQTILNPSICAGESFIYLNDTLSAQGVYEYTLNAGNGCDSNIILQLEIRDTVQTLLFESICSGSIFDFLGSPVFESGTYDSVLVAENGCDNTVILQLTVQDTFQTILFDTLCKGETYNFLGDIISTSGQYEKTLMANNGCDSNLILNLVFKDTFYTIIQDSICPGDTFDFLGNLLPLPGLYHQTLIAQNGCDSTIALNLNIRDTFDTFIFDTICAGETYSYLGDDLFNTGLYTYHLIADNDCDSTIWIDLTVLDTFQTNIQAFICPDEIYDFIGTPLSDAGVYEKTLMASNGCDSTIILDLVVKDTFYTTLSDTICQGETLLFIDTLVSHTGLYESVLVASNGCDSTVALNLLVKDTSQLFFDVEICAGETYFFNDQALFQEGIYRDTLIAANGCDSFAMLNLIIKDTIVNILTEEICNGETFIMNNLPFTATGVYTEKISQGAANGCDSTIILNLTVVDGASYGFADAGPDFTACQDTVALSASLPVNTSGEWLMNPANGTTFSSPDSNQTLLFQLEDGSNQVIWTLSTALCPDYDTDTLVISKAVQPLTFDDLIPITDTPQSYEFSVIDNDLLIDVSDWSIDVTEPIEQGILTNEFNGIFSYTSDVISFPFEVEFFYEICNEECPNLCSESKVVLQLMPAPEPKDSIFIPNTITPNGDGFNDYFEIGHLENLIDKYPRNEMIIFNRWGDIHFRQSPYQNRWDGTEKSTGRQLPDGTYYYLFRLNADSGEVYKGSISIFR